MIVPNLSPLRPSFSARREPIAAVARRASVGAALILMVACGGDDETRAVDAGSDAGALADTSGADAQTADAASDTSSDVPADGGADVSPDIVEETAFALCEDTQRVGTFELKLLEEYTTVIGQVANGVSPLLVLETVVEDGDCRFAQPVNYFCDPTCVGGETCTASGKCVPSPSNVSVGEVSATGASGDFAMSARAPVFFYTFNGDLPHPAFTASSEVRIEAAGDEGVSGFSLSANGVDVLVSDLADPTLIAGEPLSITWAAAEEPARDGARVLVDINIANHGGAPGRIECETSDDGELTVSAALVDALLANGFSGFPSLVLSRVGGGAVETDLGCVDLRLVSERAFAVVIPGLTSCSSNDDCPDGETCQPDLSCG